MKIATPEMSWPFQPVSQISTVRMHVCKWLLAVMMLVFAASAQAQTLPLKNTTDLYNADPSKGISSSDGSAVLCKEKSSFTLNASTKTDDGTVSYTSWTWDEVDANGNPTTLSSNATPNNEKLSVINAVPGWHTYRVIASAGTAGCPADPVLYTVYVLPDLSITSSIDDNTPSLSYCAASGAPTDAGKKIILNTSVSFATTPNKIQGLKDYAVTDFDLTYTWYKQEVGSTGAPVQIPSVTTSSYTIADAADNSATTEKKYNYSVKVAYTMKACADYTATTQYKGTAAQVNVTPKPSAPKISITVQ
ncbi:hypothetical protein [Chitinophaga sp. 212800010-3]|uniref:hypothetical protein n=1 Tax=unclassified Chitinophaga TaxID=2619133 RepID=UPI002DE9FB44|nr:Ig-7 domain-containing protein [Chitinophaga sp. 212800010-3]